MSQRVLVLAVQWLNLYSLGDDHEFLYNVNACSVNWVLIGCLCSCQAIEKKITFFGDTSVCVCVCVFVGV